MTTEELCLAMLLYVLLKAKVEQARRMGQPAASRTILSMPNMRGRHTRHSSLHACATIDDMMIGASR